MLTGYLCHLASSQVFNIQVQVESQVIHFPSGQVASHDVFIVIKVS